MPKGVQVRPLLPAPENGKFRQKLVVFNYIRLVASYMHLRCVIFALQVICTACVMGEYNITAERSEAISLLCKQKYHSDEVGISLKMNNYVGVLSY